MKLSVIIPTLNEADFIGLCLERVRMLEPDEVVVVDGHSTDGTAELARQHDCQVLQSERGRGHQQNQGAGHVTGDLLLFLHADCWFETPVRDQIEAYFADESHNVAAFDHQIDAEGFLYRMLERHDRRRVKRTSIAYGDQGILLRKAAFDAVGGFPQVRLMEDVRLMRELRKRFGGRPQLLPGPLHISARRWEKHGVIRQSLRNFRFRWAERLGASPDRLAHRYHSVPAHPDRTPRLANSAKSEVSH